MQLVECSLMTISNRFVAGNPRYGRRTRNIITRSLLAVVGNEVSYNELAQQVGVDKKTIASYLRILEQAFIIFRLGSFNRNLRNELKRSRKIYFLDTGMRNAVINNLNPPELRGDVGGLRKNFVIAGA